MKRNIRQILFGAGLLAILAACAKELPAASDGFSQDSEPVTPLSPARTLYSYDLRLAEDTRTTFNTGVTALSWESGDRLGVYARVGEAVSVNQSSPVRSDNGQYMVTVNSTEELTLGSILHAYYPYSAVNDAAGYTAVTLNIPVEQTQGDDTAASFETDAMPMVSVPCTTTVRSGIGADAWLQMVGLGSLVRLNLFDSNGNSNYVTRVEIEATGIAGDFTYDLTSVSYSKDYVHQTDALTVPAPSGFSASAVRTRLTTPQGLSGKTSSGNALAVYMVVAPGTFASGKIHVYAQDAASSPSSYVRYEYAWSSSTSFSRNAVNTINLNLSNDSVSSTFNGIWNADDLVKVGKLLTGTPLSADSKYLVDGNITLMADIDMAGKTWTGGILANNFNGNGCHIKNWTTNYPLFSEVISPGYTVENFVIDDSCTYQVDASKSPANVAFVVVTMRGTLQNCVNNGSVVMAAGSSTAAIQRLGALAALCGDGVTIVNCTNNGSVNVSTSRTWTNEYGCAYGGVVGEIRKATIENCTNNGNLTVSAVACVNIGGVVGLHNHANSNATAVLTNVTNTGAVTANIASAKSSVNGVGGIVGFRANQYGTGGSYKLTLENAVNTGAITVTNSGSGRLYVGGIVSRSYRDGTTVSSTNSGSISVTSAATDSTIVGGIVGGQFGFAPRNPTTIGTCINRGAISVATSTSCKVYVGGIRGVSPTWNVGVVSACENAGDIEVTNTANANSCIGGIYGGMNGWVDNCTDQADITVKTAGSYTRIGGLCSINSSTVCYGNHHGDITYEFSGAATDNYRLFAGLACGYSTCAWSASDESKRTYGTFGGSISATRTTPATTGTSDNYCGAMIGSVSLGSEGTTYWGRSADYPLCLKKSTRILGEAPAAALEGVVITEEDSSADLKSTAASWLVKTDMSGKLTHYFTAFRLVD